MVACQIVFLHCANNILAAQFVDYFSGTIKVAQFCMKIVIIVSKCNQLTDLHFYSNASIVYTNYKITVAISTLAELILEILNLIAKR